MLSAVWQQLPPMSSLSGSGVCAVIGQGPFLDCRRAAGRLAVGQSSLVLAVVQDGSGHISCRLRKNRRNRVGCDHSPYSRFRCSLLHVSFLAGHPAIHSPVYMCSVIRLHLGHFVASSPACCSGVQGSLLRSFIKAWYSSGFPRASRQHFSHELTSFLPVR